MGFIDLKLIPSADVPIPDVGRVALFVEDATRQLKGKLADNTNMPVLGAAGAPGATGAQGTAGLPGATGAQGVTGLLGATGAAGSPGAQGTAGLTGAAGATGAQGAAGVTGAAGATGAQGIQGIPGVAPAPIAMHAAVSLNANGSTDFTTLPSVAVPSLTIELKCTVADTAFAVGDQFFIDPSSDNQNTGLAFQVSKVGAVWRVRTGATMPRFMAHGTGVLQQLTVARWTYQTFQN